MMQVSALQSRQQSKEKEVDVLRRQILDYQVTHVMCCLYFLKVFLSINTSFHTFKHFKNRQQQ